MVSHADSSGWSRHTPSLSPVARRRIGWLLVWLALAGGAYGYYRYRVAHRPPAFRFETAQVDRGNIVARVTATGTLSALVTVQVGSQVSGRIQKIDADFNDRVKKGELIAKIDPRLFEAALEQARANDLSAQANLTKAEAQAEDAERQAQRLQQLAQRKLAAPADAETAQTNAAVARAQIKVAQAAVVQAGAALDQARTNLAYTNIVSPIDGIVISRNVDVGQTVAASFQAPTLFVLAENLHKMQVDTSVSEADVGRLRPGMKASFTVDAYPGERFDGVVREIRNAAQTVQNIVTYDAVVDVSNPQLRLRPGMTANVAFVTDQVNDVVRVPNAAFRFRPSPELSALIDGNPIDHQTANAQRDESGEAQKQRGTVWVVTSPLHARPVSIETGLSDDSFTQLLRGDLKVGTALVTDVIDTKTNAPWGASSSGGPHGRFL